MEAQTDYEEFVRHCLWEADRTLDREVARSLRALAERYRRLSGRSPARAGQRYRVEQVNARR
jgi:hypothetical protein